jgi:uncharacterized membrane protein
MSHHWLTVLTEEVVVGLELIALALVVLGTVQALLGLPAQLRKVTAGSENRSVWLVYSRWLVGALTVQLAADIVESSISHGWEDVGRLAAVAVIRTFLNYFLDRDAEAARAHHRAHHRPEPEEVPAHA